MWKSPTGTASGSPRTGPSTLWTVHGPTPGIVPRRAPASTGSSTTRRSSPRARRAQRITVSARFRSTPSGWNHHEGCCASTSGSGGRSRPAGPGAGSESRRHSSHHARAASIDVTRCASTVGTIWWSSVSQRPMRNPGAAARARATTSSGTGRSNGASPAPTSAGTRSSSQSAPGPQAARRRRSPSHHSRRVPGPSGVRVARQTSAAVTRVVGSPRPCWSGPSVCRRSNEPAAGSTPATVLATPPAGPGTPGRRPAPRASGAGPSHQCDWTAPEACRAASPEPRSRPPQAAPGRGRRLEGPRRQSDGARRRQPAPTRVPGRARLAGATARAQMRDGVGDGGCRSAAPSASTRGCRCPDQRDRPDHEPPAG